MPMDLIDSDVRFDISQLSTRPTFQSLSSLGEHDQDYSNFFHNILHPSCNKFQNDEDDNFYSRHLSADDHFVNLVEKSENEVSDDDDDDDPQYKLFLSHVKGNGKSFIFEMKDENGIYKTTVYDKEEPVDGRHHRNKNRNKDNDICLIYQPETNDFKEKLMALLRKPFDEQEYNTLWHEVTQKRYKLRHKELQHGGEKSVRTKIKTKSYLQKHKTFRRAIKAVPADKFKKLNILRGFVFWLQYEYSYSV